MLIIGVGNRFRRDDGAGLAAARKLRDRLPRGTRILERDGDLTGLFEDWAGENEVVLLDATSSGATPGAIRRLDGHAGRLPAGLARPSTHALGVAEVVELGRVMGSLPSSLVVYGIEGRDFSAGEGLSPEVAIAADRLADLVAAAHTAGARG